MVSRCVIMTEINQNIEKRWYLIDECSQSQQLMHVESACHWSEAMNHPVKGPRSLSTLSIHSPFHIMGHVGLTVISRTIILVSYLWVKLLQLILRMDTHRMTTWPSTMMTSSNGNIFRVIGPLWWESTSHWWIPHTKASDAELWCFIWSASEQKVEQIIEMPVIWDAIALFMTSL